MENTKVTIELTSDQVNAIQKAAIYLKEYDCPQLSEAIESVWLTIAKAALSQLNHSTNG